MESLKKIDWNLDRYACYLVAQNSESKNWVQREKH